MLTTGQVQSVLFFWQYYVLLYHIISSMRPRRLDSSAFGPLVVWYIWWYTVYTRCYVSPTNFPTLPDAVEPGKAIQLNNQYLKIQTDLVNMIRRLLINAQTLKTNLKKKNEKRKRYLDKVGDAKRINISRIFEYYLYISNLNHYVNNIVRNWQI